MDTPGSDMSTDSTDSSVSDSSSDESSLAQSIPNTSEAPIPIPMGSNPAIDDDSASDISMSAETDDEDNEALNTSAIQVNSDMHISEQPSLSVPSDPQKDTSNKRKHSDSREATANGHESNGLLQDVRKRQKPDDTVGNLGTIEGHLRQDKYFLPAEIWHHVFTFIPPKRLGLLLRVNRSFNASLDPSSSEHSVVALSQSAVQLLKPDAIWRASRRLFWPGMPAPLNGKSELDMWKLACSTSCQFCGKKKEPNTAPLDQWHPGPGENGVIPIWPFGIRACGPCLEKRTLKEIDLLLSSSFASPLVTALPSVFLNGLHVISLSALQNGQPPPTVQISKNFFQPQVEDINREFMEVQAMGAATSEEWLKGLDTRGKERRSDAARWEKWEISGGVARMRSTEPHEAGGVVTNTNGFIPTTIATKLAQIPASANSHLPVSQGYAPGTQPPTQAVQPIHTNFQTNTPTRFDSPSQNGFAGYPPRTYPQARHERTKEEVVELKAARRSEIERRSMLLDPPLTAGVLAHMASFQAAIQIIQPLTDSAWEVLKPRLLSQREDAEQRENERLAQARILQEQLTNLQGQLKPESKDLLDRDWDDQAPLRARIGGYADETIRDAWGGGEKVSRDNSSAFAAEVLIYVRKRFYAEVAKDEAAVRATGREPQMDPPDGPFTKKLTLENMKWVFDTKIKPLTEQYRKELFLCNDCDTNFKFYGFEGVIQHYAAKHTNALSNGSVVVHWKAEWPEYPPFNPEPPSGKNSYYAAAPSASVPYTAPVPQQSYGYNGYQPPPVTAPMHVSNPHGYQESPGPYYGNPQFGDQYAGPQNGPYAPPSAYPDGSQSYPAQQYSAPPPTVSNIGYSEQNQEYSQQGYGAQYPSTTQSYYTSPHPSQLYPASAPDSVGQQVPYAPSSGQYDYSYDQPAAPHPSQFPPAPPKTEEYKAQLQEIAKNARNVWDSINGLKDIPGSVKVCTIIYHVLKNSRANFQEDPPLSMIADGLSNNKDMRKVRNINGLLCRACSLGLPGASSAPQKKHFSFPQLVNHFLFIHEQGVSQNGGQVPDWTKDMIELPDLSRLTSIINTPGTSDQKFKLIVEALPEIFAAPQQSLDDGDRTDQNGAYGPSRDLDAYGLAPSQDNHEKYYSTIGDSRLSESDSVPYDNDQYDPRNPRDPRELPMTEAPKPRVLRRAEDYYPATYQDRPERSFIEQRPATPQKRLSDGYSRVIIREEPPLYLDTQPRYRVEDENEYRVRRKPVSYDDPDHTFAGRDYKDLNIQTYHSNRNEAPIMPTQNAPSQDMRHAPAGDTAAEQNRIFEVVAQISQQAKQARERQPAKAEPADGGSEDGELQGTSNLKFESGRIQSSTEASHAADQFLSQFVPGEPSEPIAKESSDSHERLVRLEPERIESLQRVYEPPSQERRPHDMYDDNERIISNRGRPVTSIVDDPASNGYIVRGRTPLARQARVAYNERYVTSAPERAVARERSPELVDRRFKLNDVVYRDERQSSHGMHRTPSRYARYESVRLENDRARSRSPVYVKVGPQPGQYRERSLEPHPSHQEPIYRTRTPQAPPEELTYERAPRQEYYRVYADEPRPRHVYVDEPRPRQPQYAEAFEYVKVSDPRGDYMIRRPVRREPEAIYATYESKPYSQAPVYESRAAVSRSDPAYYEEYDPRHPEPPPAAATVRQTRYQ